MKVRRVKGWEQGYACYQQTAADEHKDMVLGGTSPTFNGSKGSLLVLLPCDVFVLVLVMVAPLSVYIIVDIPGERRGGYILLRDVFLFPLGDFLVLV